MNKELFREEIIYSVGDSNLEENSYEMIKDVIRNNHAVGSDNYECQWIFTL